MLALLGPLLSFLGGPVVSAALNAYKAKLSQEGAVDVQLTDVAAREMQVDLRQRELDQLANQMDEGRWWTAAPRAIVTWSFALYVAKIVLYDNVFGFGSTPALHGEIADMMRQVAIVWFGGRTLEKITKTVVNRIK